jgi:hypothetical protein
VSKDGLLVQYTVYDHPLDYPDDFVVRRWIIGPGFYGSEPELFARGRTLEEVRSRLPGGLFCLNREPADDPAIVETWI